MDIPEHLIPFEEEACPGWALERKVTKRPAHSDTVQSPLCPGHGSGLNQPHPGMCCKLGAGWGAGTPLVWCCSGLNMSLQDLDLYNKMVSPLVLALLGLGG